MVRALIHPLEGALTPSGARGGAAGHRSLGAVKPRSERIIRPGYGLLIAASLSLGLWFGAARIVLSLLQ